MKSFRTLELIMIVISLVTIGASLLAYGHSNFATKDEYKTQHQDIREMRKDVRKIMVKIGVE